MNPNPPEQLEDEPSSLEDPETIGGPLGSIPRFGRSPSPPNPNLSPPNDQVTGLEEPNSPTGPDRSSPASTESQPAEEWVDPKDLQAAIGQIGDVAFVLVGQGFGFAEKRAKGLPAVDGRWVPTAEERKLVKAPLARIAKRHVKAPKEAADVVDGCLIATAVGSFALRAVMGTNPLTQEGTTEDV